MSRGTAYIFASIVFFAAIHFGFSGTGIALKSGIATFLGGTAFMLMAWAIVLSTRPSWLENAFGGLDRMYQNHKLIGVSVLLLILAHFFTIPKLDAAARLPATGLSAATGIMGSPVGMISMILLILSVVISLNRKIPYHVWINPHRLMGLIFGAILFHMLLSPEQLFNGKSPSGIFMLIVGIIGVVAWLYRQFARNRGCNTYKLDEVNKLERATELVLSPDGCAPLKFRPGQFGFLQLDKKGFREPHPFTISSAPGEGRLRFTTKVLGDFTRRVRDELNPGVSAKIEGPYGRFDMDIKNRTQVWVAGGVGITPFLSTMRDMQDDDDRDITLLYCVQEKDQALFLSEFEEKFTTTNNKIILLESNNKEFANLSSIKAAISHDLKEANYFLCGPKPMISGLQKTLKSAGLPAGQMHHEAFEFR